MIKKNSNFKEYKFRLAKLNELNQIQKFIKKNWKPNHILGRDKEYLLYQFKNKNKLNFFIAINKKNKKIESIHGFLKYSKKKIGETICGSIASVETGNHKPFLGLETFKRMLLINKPNLYIGIGTDPITMVPLIKKFLHFETGLMDHYYKINPNIKEFKIAKIKKRRKLINQNKNDNKIFEEIKDFRLLKKKIKINYFKLLPKKNFDYINKRFFKHPVYDYRYFLFKRKNKGMTFKSLIIAREVIKFKKKILRIVDFIGNVKEFLYMRNATDRILVNECFEYIDILTCNINPKYLIKSGFTLKKKNDENIIPNYFQPYLKKNVSINYVLSKKKIILFKADADQDTPR